MGGDNASGERPIWVRYQKGIQVNIVVADSTAEPNDASHLRNCAFFGGDVDEHRHSNCGIEFRLAERKCPRITDPKVNNVAEVRLGSELASDILERRTGIDPDDPAARGDSSRQVPGDDATATAHVDHAPLYGVLGSTTRL